jgi:hypothetical protein
MAAAIASFGSIDAAGDSSAGEGETSAASFLDSQGIRTRRHHSEK